MFKKYKEENKKRSSKDRLIKFLESKIKTTMIGAISDIEKEMGDYINTKDGAEVFASIRESILDRGNYQIRDLKDEIDLYNIEFNGYLLKNVIKKED